MSIKIAIVISRFNTDVTERLLKGALQACAQQRISISEQDVFKVPGAIEIPLIAKCLAEGQQYDAIVTLGAVIQGETRHFDYVCDQVSQGCLRVMLDYNLPVIFGILTTETEKQALARSGGKMGNKGQECVEAAIEMVQMLRHLQKSKLKLTKKSDKR